MPRRRLKNVPYCVITCQIALKSRGQRLLKTQVSFCFCPHPILLFLDMFVCLSLQNFPSSPPLHLLFFSSLQDLRLELAYNQEKEANAKKREEQVFPSAPQMLPSVFCLARTSVWVIEGGGKMPLLSWR